MFSVFHHEPVATRHLLVVSTDPSGPGLRRPWVAMRITCTLCIRTSQSQPSARPKDAFFTDFCREWMTLLHLVRKIARLTRWFLYHWFFHWNSQQTRSVFHGFPAPSKRNFHSNKTEHLLLEQRMLRNPSAWRLLPLLISFRRCMPLLLRCVLCGSVGSVWAWFCWCFGCLEYLAVLFGVLWTSSVGGLVFLLLEILSTAAKTSLFWNLVCNG